MAQVQQVQTQYTLPFIPKFEVVKGRTQAQNYGVVTVPSSNGKTEYRVDVTKGRCSCPSWKFQRQHNKACKHLRALGFVDLVLNSKTTNFEVEL